MDPFPANIFQKHVFNDHIPANPITFSLKGYIYEPRNRLRRQLASAVTGVFTGTLASISGNIAAIFRLGIHEELK